MCNIQTLGAHTYIFTRTTATRAKDINIFYRVGTHAESPACRLSPPHTMKGSLCYENNLSFSPSSLKLWWEIRQHWENNSCDFNFCSPEGGAPVSKISLPEWRGGPHSAPWRVQQAVCQSSTIIGLCGLRGNLGNCFLRDDYFTFHTPRFSAYLGSELGKNMLSLAIFRSRTRIFPRCVIFPKRSLIL